MSSSTTKTPLLLIPGPIEFRKEVLCAMSTPGTSHVAPSFIEQFGSVLDAVPQIFLAEKDGQPLVIAGSGSLGWDMIAANVMERGERALVINTGYFGNSFGDALEAYGMQVTHLNAEIGSAPSIEAFKKVLTENASNPFKLVTVAQVDTSTAVRAPLKEYAAALRAISPNTLFAVDGVCATAGEEFRMAEWDIDVAFTGSQKALGVPPGLMVMVARPRALAAFESRKTKVPAYYVSWEKWLPIMKSYQARQPCYFATPAVQLIMALHESCKIILSDGGIEKRFYEHRRTANAFRAALDALGLNTVAEKELCANTLSAVRYPQGIDGAMFRTHIKEAGAIVAGGLHKEIKAEYFRVGHMGLSSIETNHLLEAVKAIEFALKKQNYKFEKDIGVQAFSKAVQTAKF
eukprot:CAMPEP_0201550516 /NCGR_PEP_ID=MMETSP0173_2-20130828/6871_1 /ASSEMBLY_ACC=CAM_ASM_000268 /TAXON_ID=218659 /ORGANISM="Vexillifera sp., Strain DIVA3 564/2" /LENGTH=403 /DNA_ID=CAMNT_0047960517 /DNA_START=25 /DNA_END=1236 /DNA_ORIENTATION=-